MAKQLTIEDLRNPKRQSGFMHVSAHHYRNDVPFDWRGQAGGKHGDDWRGPNRKLPEEAAQDYCDYVNGLPVVTQASPNPKTTTKVPALMLNRASHPARAVTTTIVKSSKKRKPRKDMTDRMGTVYLIGEKGNADQVKVGWSAASGFSRLRELQTGNPRLLVGIAEKPGTQASEYHLHLAYETDNILNEWFTATPELLGEFDISQQQYELAVGAEMEIV